MIFVMTQTVMTHDSTSTDFTKQVKCMNSWEIRRINRKGTRQRQLTPIILATWEAETGRIKGQGQSVQII
jgi:hypothetical protein